MYKNNRKAINRIVIAIGVITGIFIYQFILKEDNSNNKNEKLNKKVLYIIESNIHETDNLIYSELNKCLFNISNLFENKDDNINKFSENVLSLSGKIKFTRFKVYDTWQKIKKYKDKSDYNDFIKYLKNYYLLATLNDIDNLNAYLIAKCPKPAISTSFVGQEILLNLVNMSKETSNGLTITIIDYVVDKIGISQEEYDKYIMDAFEVVIKPGELNQLINNSIVNLIQSIDANNNKLLINIYADLKELPGIRSPKLASENIFQEEYSKNLMNINNTIGNDAFISLNSELASFFAANFISNIVSPLIKQILAKLAVRLGVSAITYESGVALSVETFGISVLIAVILDRAIDKVMNLAGYDPKAKLSSVISSMIDNIRNEIINGDGKSEGLKQHLTNIINNQNNIRNKAIKNIEF